MFDLESKLAREAKTVHAMIAIHCRSQHASSEVPCAACLALWNYADQRLARCPFGEAKPNCARCTIHCYRPAMRERVREVMRSAGPKMALRHPWLSFLHEVVDARRPTPSL
jgi:hypothetical protein